MKNSTKIMGLGAVVLAAIISKNNNSVTPQKKKFVIDKAILEMETEESATDDIFMHSSTTPQN